MLKWVHNIYERGRQLFFPSLITYGHTLIEVLLTIGGFRIEAPLYDNRRMVIGTRV
ncbi:MAG: hypothetical protein K6E16_06680 [Lachnospiraceae bacterium]|nr:hypothetical protein [Lachnospiraceae bacterium]